MSREIVHAGIHDHGNFPYYSRGVLRAECGQCQLYAVPQLWRSLRKPKPVGLVEMFDGLEARDRMGVIADFQQTFSAQRAAIQRGPYAAAAGKKQEQSVEMSKKVTADIYDHIMGVS